MAAISVFMLAKWIFDTLCGFKKYILTPSHDLIKRYGEGSWALITGASDGIGKAYAQELASRGFNIVLMARNQEKTDNVSNEIKN